MITSLYVDALKSLCDKKIEIRDLTLLSGLNNSGKSTFLQAVRMFNAGRCMKSPLLDGYGSLSELRSKYSSKNTDVKISIEFSNGDSDSLIVSPDNVVRPVKGPHLIYVGADRFGPRNFLPTHQETDNMPFIGDRGEHVIDFIDKLSGIIIPKNLHHPKAEGVTLEFEIKGWLNEISPGVEFRFEKNAKADISQSEYNGYRPTNVGFGLSYTLPIIAAILSASAELSENELLQGTYAERWMNTKSTEGFFLVLENPEAHLHPQGQTSMGELIALAASSGVQIILETHSDHLMDGIRIAVKKGLCKSENIIFHYLKKSEIGLTDISTPNLDDNGKLDFWPQGFFDQTLRNRAVLAKRS